MGSLMAEDRAESCSSDSKKDATGIMLVSVPSAKAQAVVFQTLSILAM